MTETPRPPALSGIRVLDLTRVLAGPWCTQNLADLGAEVIKIERPLSGDDTRGWGPPYVKDAYGRDTTEAAYYAAANRNKYSVAVDIASARGADVVRRLACQCDVLVENFKVGGLRKYGLDYDSIRALNPALVYCSITGFGQTGPYANRPGYDFMIQGLGGLMSVTGERDELPGGGPQKAGVAVADLMTGMYSTVAILAALLERGRSGEGQHIDMALLDCQVAMLANQNMNYLTTGQAPRRAARRHQARVDRQFGQADAGQAPPFADPVDRHAVGPALTAEHAGRAARGRLRRRCTVGQAGRLVGQDDLGLVQFGAAQRRQTPHLVHRQLGEHRQETADVAVVDVAPELPEIP